MIIFYTHSVQRLEQIKSIPDIEVRHTVTQEELAASIVEGHHLICVLIEPETPSRQWQGFLASLLRSFPFLEIYLLLPREQEGYFSDFQHLPLENLRASVEQLIASLGDRNRRKHQRFDWPLKGKLTIPGQLKAEFSVRSISSTGAFLAGAESCPTPGSEGSIQIVFHDFKLMSGCRVHDQRAATSRLPDGFGIEFTDLTDVSRSVIDHLVQDEMLRSLLEPDKPTRPPSISG